MDEAGVIWLSSVIGRWVNALAEHLDEVGLLLYESQQRLPHLDTPVVKRNIRLYSLGERKTVGKRLFRRSALRQVCEQAGKLADVLLVRGITPHQYRIWRFTSSKRKAFLLVGSLKSSINKAPCSLMETILFFLNSLRMKELRKIASKETLMLANSPKLVSDIENVFNCKSYFVPTNSIRKSEFVPLHIRPVSNPCRLLYCGRLDYKKGLRELIQALALLNHQGHHCRLDVVGPVFEPVYSKLLEMTDELGISTLINWHGLVPYGPGLFEFYQRADIFILPSYSEGFPHVIWEAMANSCPVISTSVGGIPALLGHQEHALLIQPKDVDAIVTAVKRLISETELRRLLVERAYGYALNFTVEACARKLADVLSQEWK